MRTKRKLFSVLLSLIILVQIFSNIKINVNAAGGYFTEDSFSLTPNAYTDSNNQSFSAYTMTNDSGLLSGFYYYMKVEEGKAICCEGGEVITNILNYKIGVTMSAVTLANFISSYVGNNNFTGMDPNYFNLLRPVLKNGSIVGVALNDITGCRMAYADDTDQVSIPSAEVNNVYNFYNYWLIQNPITPDYIVLPCYDRSYVETFARQTNRTNILNWCDNTSHDYDFYIGRYNANNQDLDYLYNGNQNRVAYFESNDLIYVQSSGFNNIVNAFNLTDTNYTISFEDVMSSTASNTLNTYAYDNSGNQLTPKFQGLTDNFNNNITSKNVIVLQASTKSLPFSKTQQSITVYKNLSIKISIENNTYQKSVYTSNNTKNYNTNNNNSYNTTVQNINNSSSNNTNIYNNSSSETNNNIQNNEYNIDNSVNDNSVTTIINNYYGDNGSGSGGGDDDDDDDDTIWKALLKAIADFFTKIGELIATLLTGIFSIFTSILDAITSITEDFTSITSFLSSFFSWLPTPIISLIVLGLGLALICSFLTWFKK